MKCNFDVVVFHAVVVDDPANHPLKFGLILLGTAEISMTLSLRWVGGGGGLK